MGLELIEPRLPGRNGVEYGGLVVVADVVFMSGNEKGKHIGANKTAEYAPSWARPALAQNPNFIIAL